MVAQTSKYLKKIKISSNHIEINLFNQYEALKNLHYYQENKISIIGYGVLNHLNLNFTKKIFSYYSEKSHELFNKIEWVNAEVGDLQSLQIAMKGIEKVYHCAAIVSFHENEKDLMFKTNIEGTANIVKAALYCGVKKICYVSSIAAIGRAEREVDLITEETPWEESPNNSNYSKSKYASEQIIWDGAKNGLDCVIVNPSIIVGPGDWKKGSANLITTVWKGINFYTLGVNGYVDVRDVSKAMIKLMDSEIKNERFILSSENLTYRDLFFLIADSLNCKRPKIKISKLMGKIILKLSFILKVLGKGSDVVSPETLRTANTAYFYSGEKIRNQLGFEFIPIKKSIDDTCKIFLSEEVI